MDDPMIRSRLGRINGTRPFGALDPKQEPLFFLRTIRSISRTASFDRACCSWNGSAAGGLEMSSCHSARQSFTCMFYRTRTDLRFLARLSGVFNATKDGYLRPTQTG